MIILIGQNKSENGFYTGFTVVRACVLDHDLPF